MGVDKNDIRTVIHHRVPATYEEYLQESGRAGRDGKTADAYVIVTRKDNEAEQPYSPVLETFRPHKDGSLQSCRRRSILHAMGQEKDECTGCDVCLGQLRTAMSADRQIRRLIRRWPFRFSATIASNLLCGVNNAGLVDAEATFDPLYGSVRGWNPKELSETIRSLSDDRSSYPVSGLRYLGNSGSDLLYPSDKLIYNSVASLLRRIDHGYRWIIRKTRCFRRKGKGRCGKKAD